MQNINEMVRDFTQVQPRSKSEVRRRILEYAKEAELPMGIGQWLEHGKKYGYWDYVIVDKVQGLLEAHIQEILEYIRVQMYDIEFVRKEIILARIDNKLRQLK